jgi:hypothetical protein
MEKLNIDINLSGQQEGKFRTFYLVLGSTGLIYFALTLFIPDLNFNYYAWIAFIPGFIESILYGLGKKRIFTDHFPHLQINDEIIEKSKGGLFAKSEIYHWDKVKSIDVRLFEIHITTTDNIKSNIDLTTLTDENLKIVKDFVLTIKKQRGL